MIKYLLGVVAVFTIALGLSACSLFNSGPATVSDKYGCTQTVNGHKAKTWCIQDSNGNNFYVPWAVYRSIIIGQDESRYLPASYTNSTVHEPPVEDVPVEYHPVVDDPVDVHPVVVDGK